MNKVKERHSSDIANISAAQRRTWLLLAIEGKRQHGGNDGYADVPGKIYRFDSFVPNARHVNAGDIAIFRDRTGAFGFASVHHVNSTDGEKTLLRCPVCNVIQIKERTTVTPKYRCRGGHLFDTPTAEVRKCKQYEAHFGNSFIKADTVIPPSHFRIVCSNFNGQLSIQEASLAALIPFIARSCPLAVSSLLLADSQLTSLVAEDDSNPYVIATTDPCERISRQIRARRGQQQFRNALLARYHSKCLVTECPIVDLLEAAHICPYRSETDNHPENGLLLRCDLHTLFDLDLLGIEPSTLTVHLHSALAGHSYDKYNGLALRCDNARPSSEALELRWQAFLWKSGASST